MKIVDLKTNRLTNPLGFDLGTPHFSFIVEETDAKSQVAARIEISLNNNFNENVFDSGKSAYIDSLAYEPKITLKSCTRYYWRVTVWANNCDIATSEIAWFETAKIDKPWIGKWITPEMDKTVHPILFKEVDVKKMVRKARMYITGLGLYELYVNGKKIGKEYLTPGCNAYDKWVQYQTYEINDLAQGNNCIEVMLGNGWYKGRFGFEEKKNIYGDSFVMIAQLEICYDDGSTEIVVSDSSWQARKSKIKSSEIYDGEVWDESFSSDERFAVKEVLLGKDKLKARLSPTINIEEILKPVELIKTTAGEIVLDMGQNMVGWLEFKTNAIKGTELLLQYGEVLQDDNFYRENLRTAKAEFRYISGGGQRTVRPHFTFYGFRYVKLTGWQTPINLDDFTGCVLHSHMDRTGNIETSDSMVNRLFLNALWGQKGNFVDVSTDCPQRDERMGWTGDAQVFSGTASYNMDTFAFYTKNVYDLALEQQSLKGSVPYVVPMIGYNASGSTAWGDAATIIPWNVYLHFGDRAILKEQFQSMKAWVDYIRSEDEKSGGRYLWTTGSHFGDWLALDTNEVDGYFGATDPDFIASAYYCYSAGLVAKAAQVLGKTQEFKKYEMLSKNIRKSIQKEYFSPNGRLSIDTQTAYVVALFFDLVPLEYRDRVANDLKVKLKQSKNHLTTGFVGTPYLCLVLSENGMNDLAYTLLLNKDYPGWLYEVGLGATTIWERWNSLLPDGRISSTGMNSLNHYAYGSIVEWMYRYMAGIRPDESCTGFRHAKIAPQPDYRITWVKAEVLTAAGLYKSEWKITGEKLLIHITIPFNTSAEIDLPNCKIEGVMVNGKILNDSKLAARQDGNKVVFEADAGSYDFSYKPIKPYRKYYNLEYTLAELMKDERTQEVMLRYFPELAEETSTLRKICWDKPFTNLRSNPFQDVTDETMEKVATELAAL